MKKIIPRILGGSVFAISALVVIIFLLHPRIPLGLLTGPFSSVLSFFTGSEQVVRGNYFIIPGSWTTLAVENGSLELSGREGFQVKTEISTAQATVHLWSLFTKEINLDGLVVQGMTLDVRTGGEKESSVPEEKEQNHSRFLPFTVKKTGNPGQYPCRLDRKE